MINIDWSKARAIHNLYGHYTFLRYMKMTKKTKPWAQSICTNLKCKEEIS